jgi:predicted lipoprotein with Yx(FWY)xxD motif
MLKCAAPRLIVVLLTLAADGCRGYSLGSGVMLEDASMLDASRVSDASSRAPTVNQRPSKPDLSDDAGSIPDTSVPKVKPPVTEPPVTTPVDASEPAMEMDASTVIPVDAGADSDLRLERSASFDGYITDGAGEPLYMFVGDVPSASETGCLTTCASVWPTFDLIVEHVSEGLDVADVSRFHRQDGAWQTTYKGHPLYRRAAEAGKLDVTSDSLDGRWFVARDYLAFMSAARTFAPAGGMETNGPFLTDGLGRTLYICLEDEPATLTIDPISSCDAQCAMKWPVFGPPDGKRAALLPSVIDPRDLTDYVRSDGARQFVYRGWPLHYYSGDVVVGATEGHNDGAWRAIDPVGFGVKPEGQL